MSQQCVRNLELAIASNFKACWPPLFAVQKIKKESHTNPNYFILTETGLFWPGTFLLLNKITKICYEKRIKY